MASIQSVTKAFLLPVTLSLVLLTACGGSGGSKPTTGGSDTASFGLLKPATSETEFLASIKQGVEAQTQSTDRGDQGSGLPQANNTINEIASSSSFSSTYTLEANVGEYDVVKYDGDHLFIARQLGFSCCFIAQPLVDLAASTQLVSDDPSLIAPANAGSAIRILATDTGNASATEVNEIELPEQENLLGMFLNEDRLAAVTSEYFYNSYGHIWASDFAWANVNTGIKIYNVSDVTEAKLDWDVSFEGGLAQSRRLGNTVYIVTRHNFVPADFNYNPVTQEERNENQRLLNELSMEDVAATVTINGQERDLFTAQDCFIDNDDQPDSGSGTITSITAVPMDNPNNMQTICYPESAEGVYVTENSLYITSVRYAQAQDAYSTRVHKFGLDNSAPEYRGSGDVEGAIWLGGQQDFRMSEYQNKLRLVTSSWTRDEEDRIDHMLHILEEDSSEPALVSVAQLPNTARPEEIGKPNEDLYGVRFQQDRAYLVTFERIDPLYVLNLQDTDDPFIAGELEVTGFSDFLHPVNDELLLGLGREDNLVKLELFNVGDISNPLSQDLVLLDEGAAWSWSEAQYDRHAFTYLAGTDTDRFAIPVDSWFEDGRLNLSTLHGFEITGKNNPAVASLDSVGKIEARDGENKYFSSPRSVLHNDALFYIWNSQVWSALWGETGTEVGPQ